MRIRPLIHILVLCLCVLYSTQAICADDKASGSASQTATDDYFNTRSELERLIGGTDSASFSRTQWINTANHFQELYNNNPNWKLRVASLYHVARTYENMAQQCGTEDDSYQALRTYRLVTERFPNHPLADDALYCVARILFSRNNNDEAQSVLNRILQEYPNGDMAQRIRKESNLPEQAPKSIPQQNITQSQTQPEQPANQSIASIKNSFSQQGSFEQKAPLGQSNPPEQRNTFEQKTTPAIQSTSPQRATNVPSRATDVSSKGVAPEEASSTSSQSATDDYYSTRSILEGLISGTDSASLSRSHWTNTANHFQALYNNNPNWRLRVASLYHVARTYENMALRCGTEEDSSQALKIYTQVTERFPNHPLADDALYCVARILFSKKNNDEAQSVLVRILQEYPNGDMAQRVRKEALLPEQVLQSIPRQNSTQSRLPEQPSNQDTASQRDSFSQQSSVEKQPAFEQSTTLEQRNAPEQKNNLEQRNTPAIQNTPQYNLADVPSRGVASAEDTQSNTTEQENADPFSSLINDYFSTLGRLDQLLNGTEPTVNSRTPWINVAKHFQELCDNNPTWHLRAASLYRVARTYEGMAHQFGSMEDASTAIDIYTSIPTRFPNSPLVDDALFCAARVHATINKNNEQAKKLLKKILNTYPKSDMAQRIREELQVSSNILSVFKKENVIVSASSKSINNELTSEETSALAGKAFENKAFQLASSSMNKSSAQNTARLAQNTVRSTQPSVKTAQNEVKQSQLSIKTTQNEAKKTQSVEKKNQATGTKAQTTGTKSQATGTKSQTTEKKDVAPLKTSVASVKENEIDEHEHLTRREPRHESRPTKPSVLEQVNVALQKDDAHIVVSTTPQTEWIARSYRANSNGNTYPCIILELKNTLIRPDTIRSSKGSGILHSVQISDKNDKTVAVTLNFTKLCRFLVYQGKEKENIILKASSRDDNLQNGRYLGEAISSQKVSAPRSVAPPQKAEPAKIAPQAKTPASVQKPSVQQNQKKQDVKSQEKQKATDSKGKQKNTSSQKISSQPVLSDNIASQLGLTARTIILDAGHGGKDPGAIGNNISEKNINLAICKALAQKLKRKGFSVHMTRSDDSHVALQDRPVLAKSSQGDLFISIHINSNEDKRVSGFETYYLNFAKTDDDIRIATVENSVGSSNLGEMDAVVAELVIDARTKESEVLAGHIHKNTIQNLSMRKYGTHNGGIRSAPFRVLMAGMPSVLIEAGYCSNKKEAQLLTTPEYINTLADGIANGIVRYVNSLGKKPKAS